jgi:hypothetical protein
VKLDVKFLDHTQRFAPKLSQSNGGGATGADGKSAYEIAVDNGFVGTE